MKVQQSFVIEQPPAKVWDFLEDVPSVARCVPGVEEVEVIDDEQSRVRLTQSVGPMSATFDLKMRITERVPGERLQFTAIGKAVKGAAGSVRTVNTVSLAPEGDATRVALDADMAMGGVLGSVGQKVIAKQATGVTAEFARALERALNGEATATAADRAAPDGASGPRTTSSAGTSSGTTTREARVAAAVPVPHERLPWHADPRVTGLAGLSTGLAIALAVALRRR